MSEWRTIDHSKEQIAEIESVLDGGGSFITWGSVIRYNKQSIPARTALLRVLELADKFWICNPHPRAEMAKQQFDTGQPVWIRYNGSAKDRNQKFHDFACRLLEANPAGFKTTEPNWYSPFYDFSFTPFEEG